MLQTFAIDLICLFFFPVIQANKSDLLLLTERLSNSSEDNILRLDGLPWCSTEQNIRDFFQGLIYVSNALYFIAN